MVDVRALLNEVRERTSWSWTELAAQAGTSRATIGKYVSGTASPTVRTLDRVLAAAGLQARLTLEPLQAELDSLVDAMLEGEVVADWSVLEEFAQMARVEQSWSVEDEGTGEISQSHGVMTWAFDGSTALNLHGLACDSSTLMVTIVLDMAARAWMARGFMRASPGPPVGWFSGALSEVQHSARDYVVGGHGLFQVRFVEELRWILDVRLPGSETVVPVVTPDEVERGHPQLAEVLARLRARQAGT